ncbi:MAG: S-layer homology domain-containing protein, partial [Syntrophomonadaceae bacterium]|nr:S-layer homology domain-containing protein [Syntrophomonadaceae bacterium]
LDKIQLHLEDVEANTQDIRLYKQAIASKIIPNQGKFNPLATISREELAIWSINTLGLDEVGQMKNLIAVPVNDADKISLGKQNYIGLAYGLGLIKPDENGNINPQQAVTWNDLATCVTRLAVMPVSN